LCSAGPLPRPCCLGRWPFPSGPQGCTGRIGASSSASMSAFVSPEGATSVSFSHHPLSKTHLASSGPLDVGLLLLGCSKISPPSSLGSVSTPTRLATCFGSTLPSAEHVPSSWVLTTSTAFSTESPAGLLHPTSDHGVHRVAVALALSRLHSHSHRCLSLQSLPLISSRALRLRRPLPSHRYRLRHRPDLKALLHS